MKKEELFNFVFNDGEEYTEFYFNKRRNKLHTVYKGEKDNVIALAGYVPITIKGSNQKIKTALITGVCTHPNERGKGIMQSLLTTLFEELKNLKYDIAVLSPANDNYYKKFGFKSLVCGNFKQIKFSQNSGYTIKKATKIDTNLILSLYNDTIKTKFSQQLDENTVLDLLDEFSMENQNISIVLKEENPIGFIATDGNKVEIAVIPDINILSQIQEIDCYSYFVTNNSGNKDLFQIKYLNDNISNIDLNEVMILNKY